MLSKDWLFERGGRPVIYGDQDQFNFTNFRNWPCTGKLDNC